VKKAARKALYLFASAATIASAQAPTAIERVASMGQPPRWEPYGLASALGGTGGSSKSAVLGAGAYRAITNPVTGLLGLTGEVYFATGAADARKAIEPGARLLATSRAIGLSAGMDVGRSIGPMLSFQTALRRGGLLGHGTMVRLDWLPKGQDRLGLGISVPIGQPLAGRTRPREDEVRLSNASQPAASSSPLGAAARIALTRVASAATQILAYTNLYADDTAAVRYGRSYVEASRTYQGQLVQAFASAAGNPSFGAELARRARAGLLSNVLLPYDSLFGQVRPDDIGGLLGRAQTQFVRWLNDSSPVSAQDRAGVASVHREWLRIVQAIQANLLAQWRDSRLVWLPLQLALTEDQYDEQTEVDALIERAVGRPFSDRNALTYLRSTDLPLEIARSIFAARDYHVLWTHDFTGRRDITRELDGLAFTMVADAYLPALTRAVQRYDSVGHLPAYIILLDQFYYANRDGRLWMDILENPLDARIKLPGRNAEREALLQRRQEELRRAVAQSRRLQREAADGGGVRWLHDVVKVHVNVVLPADFSFRSSHIIPGFPFMADNLQRDHRKVALYDINDADPYRGAMILMGVGIGEHYASATWEDRGYRIRGPAALAARDAVVEALARNGVPVERLPRALRSTPRSNIADGDSDSREYIGRALVLNNEAGFGPKQSSVARAMLYNLAPPGSVIVVPDPLWVSETWAAMLAGAAARGCRVFVISPSLANAPNPQPAVAAVQHDVMLRLLDIARRLGPQITAAGGELRVGLYTARAEVTDVAGRRSEITEGLRRSPWIKDLFPFDPATLAVLNSTTTRTEADGKSAASIAHDERPRLPMLHQKTQLIARPGAIAALLTQPGWDNVLAQAMEVQSEQTAMFADQFGWTTPAVDSSATRTADAMLRGFESALTARERSNVSFYFSLGTQNEDPRGLMQDGEMSVVVSGLHAAMGLVDLYYIMARSTWIEGKSDLDRLLPRPKGLQARIARMIRAVL